MNSAMLAGLNPSIFYRRMLDRKKLLATIVIPINNVWSLKSHGKSVEQHWLIFLWVL